MIAATLTFTACNSSKNVVKDKPVASNAAELISKVVGQAQ